MRHIRSPLQPQSLPPPAFLGVGRCRAGSLQPGPRLSCGAWPQPLRHRRRGMIHRRRLRLGRGCAWRLRRGRSGRRRCRGRGLCRCDGGRRGSRRRGRACSRGCAARPGELHPDVDAENGENRRPRAAPDEDRQQCSWAALRRRRARGLRAAPRAARGPTPAAARRARRRRQPRPDGPTRPSTRAP